ncbi:hypothetical protein PoB_005440800 [Plakobranchus ocellatus]|uniref:Uncharacterized protein n=1 Tax=Plakobranchus ocellatus TaxID=259542 RepID=A0AAV4C8R2_9GAST|nr:hypothetical protein PoB_005440800 [Plakobranchus ocellatus]
MAEENTNSITQLRCSKNVMKAMAAGKAMKQETSKTRSSRMIRVVRRSKDIENVTSSRDADRKLMVKDGKRLDFVLAKGRKFSLQVRKREIAFSMITSTITATAAYIAAAAASTITIASVAAAAFAAATTTASVAADKNNDDNNDNKTT